jgi:hypothetical protein
MPGLLPLWGEPLQVEAFRLVPEQRMAMGNPRYGDYVTVSSSEFAADHGQRLIDVVAGQDTAHHHPCPSWWRTARRFLPAARHRTTRQKRDYSGLSVRRRLYLWRQK